jgi:hypothetical protein
VLVLAGACMQPFFGVDPVLVNDEVIIRLQALTVFCFVC